MKNFTLLLTLLLVSSCASTNHLADPFIQPAPATPEQELQALKDGNHRFMMSEKAGHDFHYQIDKTKNGQTPYAVILSCIDSRVPPEIVFDQGIGEVFVARVAGNIDNTDILGSLEFGTALAGAKLIVVLGHTKCGAIKGACQNAKLGNLTSLLNKIQPAVKKVKISTPKFDSNSYDDVDHVSEENVKMTVARIRQKSGVIRDLERQHKIRLIGAMYDISSGQVQFYEN